MGADADAQDWMRGQKLRFLGGQFGPGQGVGPTRAARSNTNAQTRTTSGTGRRVRTARGWGRVINRESGRGRKGRRKRDGAGRTVIRRPLAWPGYRKADGAWISRRARSMAATRSGVDVGLVAQTNSAGEKW